MLELTSQGVLLKVLCCPIRLLGNVHIAAEISTTTHTSTAWTRHQLSLNFITVQDIDGVKVLTTGCFLYF